MRVGNTWGAIGGATLVLIAVLCLAVAPAQAQLARTFVSAATGNDANDCNRLTPCRTFQRAHDQTLALGEITVLDAGGYGAVTITKGISIINDGVGEAGVLVSGGANGITIAATPTDSISLRGLTLKGIGFGGGGGILFNTGGSLTVENCAIRTMLGGGSQTGIQFRPNASSRLDVSNTVLTDDVDGITVNPTGSGTVSVVLSRVEVYNGTDAISFNGSNSTGIVRGTVADSVAAGQAGFAIEAISTSAPTSILLTRSVVSDGAGTGVLAQFAKAIVRIGQSTITGNTNSWNAAANGIVESYGDNNIDGNGDNNPAPPTIATK